MHDWRAAINSLEGAYAPNTIRGYRSDFGAFADWCANHAFAPVPASPSMVAAFLDDQARIASPATVKRRLAGIRRVHALLSLPDPTHNEAIKLALRRARRSKPTRPAQALGLTAPRRDALISACAADLLGLRNRALIAVGYDTLCRRSELVALRVEDLEPTCGGGLRCLVRRAKSDPFGMGRPAWVSSSGHGALTAWLAASAIQRGVIFRPVVNGRVLDRSLHAYTVTRVLKDLATRAGFSADEVTQISGHSMRIGAAQDLMRQGRDITTIMRAGGWKSMNVVARYVENADVPIWD